MAENRIAGKYTRRGSDRLTYSYEASWERAKGGCTWRATVSLNGSIVGKPGGAIPGDPRCECSKLVERMVNHCIENAIGVA